MFHRCLRQLFRVGGCPTGRENRLFLIRRSLSSLSSCWQNATNLIALTTRRDYTPRRLRLGRYSINRRFLQQSGVTRIQARRTLPLGQKGAKTFLSDPIRWIYLFLRTCPTDGRANYGVRREANSRTRKNEEKMAREKFSERIVRRSPLEALLAESLINILDPVSE